MKFNPYKAFPNFVLRSTLLPVNFYKELSESTISDKRLLDIFDDKIIKEAIFLASPILLIELEKWQKGNIEDPDKIVKLRYSFIKYLSRLSSRCTPFGLFAGCSLGNFGDETNIKIQKLSHIRSTRLDMNYLVALAYDLSKIENIKKQLLFYPNGSIYKAGKQLRYVDYQYIGSRRFHNIVAVENSEYLNKILECTSKGLLFNDIVNLLINEEISLEDSTIFVNELLSSQFLISELEPSVTGLEFLDQLEMFLLKFDKAGIYFETLNRIRISLYELDKNIGNPLDKYYQISENLNYLNTDFDLKYLFQTDMFLKPKNITLNKDVIKSVLRGISFFNRITFSETDTMLDEFKKSFIERYDTKQVPLSVALDTEIGVGYNQSFANSDVSPLLDDIFIEGRINDKSNVKWNPIYSVLDKILMSALINKDYSISLNDKDFVNFKENWDDLPDTISAMIEVVQIDGETKIKFSGVGGSSAANLLSRFCNGDKNLHNFTKEIIDLEEKMNPNKILAEIVHLPESRVGNILMRPAFRKYEIPYLAKSTLQHDNQILISDLLLNVSGNEIKLKSKNIKTEILPRLTTAHNYSSNALPLYHFLSDLQLQNKRRYIGINLAAITSEYEFIPRVEYYDLILSEATWNFKKADMDSFQKLVNDDNALMEAINNFAQLKKLPQYVLLSEGDNDLLINLKNVEVVKMFLKTIKNKNKVKITEFLFHDNGIVESLDGKEYYANEIVLSFYNSKKRIDE